MSHGATRTAFRSWLWLSPSEGAQGTAPGCGALSLAQAIGTNLTVPPRPHTRLIIVNKNTRGSYGTLGRIRLLGDAESRWPRPSAVPSRRPFLRVSTWEVKLLRAQSRWGSSLPERGAGWIPAGHWGLPRETARGHGWARPGDRWPECDRRRPALGEGPGTSPRKHLPALFPGGADGWVAAAAGE